MYFHIVYKSHACVYFLIPFKACKYRCVCVLICLCVCMCISAFISPFCTQLGVNHPLTVKTMDTLKVYIYIYIYIHVCIIIVYIIAIYTCMY